MAFKDFPGNTHGIELLQRSLERGRLGHAYLLSGDRLEELETLARTLAKTLNCQQPIQRNGRAIDCCDECLTCRKIDHGNHADVFWVRPESKMRQIRIEQIARRDESPPRVVNEFVHLRPTEAEYKVCVLVGADRLNTNAANAFLKTLEEPPQKSILVLLSTEPQRLLETILSRCLRLNFAGDGRRKSDPEETAWLERFGALAAAEQKSLLGRYRLLDVLLQRLTEIRTRTDESLTARSPLQQYDDIEKSLRDKWEDELTAAVEAEYRRQRSDLLLLLECWLRDVWLHTLAAGKDLLNFPSMTGTQAVAKRISPQQAVENLRTVEHMQRLLYTNVQEALALEVGLLKLHF